MEFLHMASLRIRSIHSTIVDVPTLRKHKLSNTSVTAQSYVIVQVRLENGQEGVGEAATLGGPRWSEESVESIKATVDAYLAPALIGMNASQFELVLAKMDAAAKRNHAAKAAIDSALFDAVGKSLDLSASQFLGGAVRDRMKVLWTLASGDPVQEVEEAEAKLAAREHDTFKVKIGSHPPDADIARLRHLARALEGRATLIVDANQAWNEITARRCLPLLAEIGIALVEQPLPAWNLAGMARLRGGPIPLMADESVFSIHDMLAVSESAAADVVSLKLVKHGSLLKTRSVAAVAEAAGVGLYGGCLLESSIGAAAHLQVFSTLRDLPWGCEHFGPRILVDDLATEPLEFENFEIKVPQRSGLGVTLDPDKLRHYARS